MLSKITGLTAEWYADGTPLQIPLPCSITVETPDAIQTDEGIQMVTGKFSFEDTAKVLTLMIKDKNGNVMFKIDTPIVQVKK